VILATERLELVRATADRLRADLAGPTPLAVALAAIVPENWPPEFYDRGAIEWMLRYAEDHPAQLQWGMYYVIDPAAPDGPTVAGVVGFKGAPERGIVELGYSILAQFRRRGYATEAVGALVELAFAHDEVDRIAAQTLPQLDASIGVLLRSRFVLVGAGSDTGAIRYELTRAGRNDG
jgi:RimJ/RimL family protein N-acetyltransferase